MIRNIALFILTLMGAWAIGLCYYIYLINSYKTDLTTTDAIVVIAGGGNRAETAINLLKSGYAPVLFITGTSAPEQLKNLLQEHNVKAEQVIYPPNINISKSTPAMEIANFIINKHLTSMRLVASTYDMPSIINTVERALPVNTRVRIVASPVHNIQNQYKELLRFYNKYLLSFT